MFCEEHDFFCTFTSSLRTQDRNKTLEKKVVSPIPVGSVSETVLTISWARSLPFTDPFTLAFQWHSVILNGSARLTSSAFPWLGEKADEHISKCHLLVALK